MNHYRIFFFQQLLKLRSVISVCNCKSSVLYFVYFVINLPIMEHPYQIAIAERGSVYVDYSPPTHIHTLKFIIGFSYIVEANNSVYVIYFNLAIIAFSLP